MPTIPSTFRPGPAARMPTCWPSFWTPRPHGCKAALAEESRGHHIVTPRPQRADIDGNRERSWIMAMSEDFGAILTAAVQGGYVAHLADQTYAISSPIVIPVNSTIQGPLGVDGGGATLVSQVTDGSPLIR